MRLGFFTASATWEVHMGEYKRLPFFLNSFKWQLFKVKWQLQCGVYKVRNFFLKYDITSTVNKRGQMDLFCHKGLAFHVK